MPLITMSGISNCKNILYLVKSPAMREVVKISSK